MSGYEILPLTGTWTPAFSFATPGDLAVTYSFQGGNYTKIGRLVTFYGRLTTSAFTHTTASGAARVTGFPFAASGAFHGGGSVGMRGYTKATATQLLFQTIDGQTYMEIIGAGSGLAATQLTAADIPTGGTLSIYFHGAYNI